MVDAASDRERADQPRIVGRSVERGGCSSPVGSCLTCRGDDRGGGIHTTEGGSECDTSIERRPRVRRGLVRACNPEEQRLTERTVARSACDGPATRRRRSARRSPDYLRKQEIVFLNAVGQGYGRTHADAADSSTVDCGVRLRTAHGRTDEGEGETSKPSIHHFRSTKCCRMVPGSGSRSRSASLTGCELIASPSRVAVAVRIRCCRPIRHTSPWR